MKRAIRLLSYLVVALATSLSLSAQSPGDVMFVGYNVYDLEGFAFVLTKPFPAGDTVKFSTHDWEGDGFKETGAGAYLCWTNTTGDTLPGGTVVIIDSTATNNPSASIGEATYLGSGNFNFNPANGTQIWAFAGSPDDPVFYSALFTHDRLDMGPPGQASTLENTGLSLDFHVLFLLDDEPTSIDLAIYAGDLTCDDTVSVDTVYIDSIAVDTNSMGDTVSIDTFRIDTNINVLIYPNDTLAREACLQMLIDQQNWVWINAPLGNRPDSIQWPDDVPILFQGSAFPIQLLYFTAHESRGKVMISWATAVEIDNDHFIVQSSTDGISFKKLAKITGRGSSKVINKYSIIDRSPSVGSNYYRLKQVDFDGSVTISPVAVITIADTDMPLTLVNTLASDRLIIRSSVTSEVNYTIYDSYGVLLANGIISSDSDISVSSMVPGLYHLQLVQGSEAATFKFIKN